MRPYAHQAEPVPRREPISLEKLEHEGIPREIQTVLGWEINTRLLLLRLLKEKFVAYTSDVDKLLAEGKTTMADLESILGKLVHTSYVVPLSRHYLSRLRSKLSRMKKAPYSKRQWQLHKMEKLSKASLSMD